MRGGEVEGSARSGSFRGRHALNAVISFRGHWFEEVAVCRWRRETRTQTGRCLHGEIRLVRSRWQQSKVSELGPLSNVTAERGSQVDEMNVVVDIDIDPLSECCGKSGMVDVFNSSQQQHICKLPKEYIGLHSESSLGK